MAARLAWITTSSLEKGETPRVLALVGAAHVKGMNVMLSDPAVLKKRLDRLELQFTPPVLMRRVVIVGD
jgi:pheromone shutdown protein TraB